jgi:hypothetical protein|tara:strand:+ start:4904 stop:5302 length:399 start_codon:yes stop_codon:yes gene_type:complete
MAKWINFHVIGGHDASGAVPAEDGDNLLLADSIISVSVAEVSSRMTATIKTNGPAAADTCTVLVSTDSKATDPDTATPSAADYEVQLKEAINKAITGNPGGVKSTVVAPQDALAGAKYDPSKKVYFKSFKVA